MEAIKDTISAFMQALAQRKAGDSAEDPVEILKKILTKKELRHIKVSYSTKETVYVNVDSAALLYQLSLQKAQILALLQKTGAHIRDIRFRVGAITDEGHTSWRRNR